MVRVCFLLEDTPSAFPKWWFHLTLCLQSKSLLPQLLITGAAWVFIVAILVNVWQPFNVVLICASLINEMTIFPTFASYSHEPLPFNLK